MIPNRIRQSAPAQFVIIHAIAIGAPLAIICGAGPLTAPLQSGLQFLVATAFVLTSTLILAESLISIPQRTGPGVYVGRSFTDVQDITIILVAYLPNEQEVIMESANAILDDLDYPADRLQLIVAYNTPEDLPVEAELHALAARNDSLEIVRVHGSSSKAENLVAAMTLARGTFTAVIDSDHRLHPESARRALRWFDEGYDIVQGRCVIRNNKESILARLVSIEFEQIYGVAHSGRSRLMDTAIFGGANGWWRTVVIRDLGFDESMLTEDIDISMRSMLAGFKIVHDRTVLSTELAPTGWGAWWKQRTRWAQGWLQVSMRHQRAVMQSPLMSWQLKAYWSVLLTWREIFPLITLQIITLPLSELVLQGKVTVHFDPLDGLSTLLTLSSGGVAAWGTWRLSTTETRQAHGPWLYAFFGICAGPYTMVRNAVALVALAREVMGDHRWVVTARTKTVANGAAATIALVVGLAALASGGAHAALAADAGTGPGTPESPHVPARTNFLVKPTAQPAELSASNPQFSYTGAVPGYWHAIEGEVTLRLSGARQLAVASRIALVVNGRQIAASRAYPGVRTVRVKIPRQLIPDHQLTFAVQTRLTTRLVACPTAADPTATLQILPGSKLKLSPELSRNVVISDAPGALINAFGSEPSSVRLRFKGTRTPAAIRAAGVAAGAISVARGYPGATVHVVGGHAPATITLADRPGPPRMTITQHRGVPTLAIAGQGEALVKAALLLTSPNLAHYDTKSVENPSASPEERDAMPQTLALGGADDMQAGTSTSTVLFNLPGRYEVRAGARLRFVGSIEGLGITRSSVELNGRTLSAKVSTAPGFSMDVNQILAGRGPSYLLGDLRPGDNQLTLQAVTIGASHDCLSQPSIHTTINPTGTIDLQPRRRRLDHTSLANWPFPLDSSPNWSRASVVLPKRPTSDELAAVISVLAESARLDGEPALPSIVDTIPAVIRAPTLILARPDQVPASMKRRIAGGTPLGTLAELTSGGGALVLAVGTDALMPLMNGYQPNSLDAFTADVVHGERRIRTPNTTIATEAEPMPGHVKWPLLVLGFSVVILFAMALRAAHRAKDRERLAVLDPTGA